MFDIAWSELLIIGVVALVVVGPKDLPKMMRTAGQWAGKARAMADQLRRSFDDMARQSELEELRAEVERLKNDPTIGDIANLSVDSIAPEIKQIEADMADAAAYPLGVAAPAPETETAPAIAEAEPPSVPPRSEP